MSWKFWKRKMQGPLHPTCGKPVDLLSTTNEWEYYCKHCDRRYNKRWEPMPGPYHLEFVREEASVDYWDNPMTVVTWRCAKLHLEFRVKDYGRNRYNTCLEYSCGACGDRLSGDTMQQDQWGNSADKVRKTIGKSDESSGLDSRAKDCLRRGECPDCGASKFWEGPSGGMCTNVECSGCGSKFNVSSVFMERI